MTDPVSLSRPLRFDANIEAKDADHVSEYVSQNINPVDVRPFERGAGVKIEGSFGFAEGIAIWRTNYQFGAELLPRAEFDGIFCYVPVRGTLIADMHRDVYRSTQTRALIGDGTQFRSLRFGPGRTEIGFCIDRRVLIGRLSRLLDKPFKEKLAFQSDVSVVQGAGAALLGYMNLLSDTAFGSALNNAPSTAEGMMSTLVDMALELLPHNYSTHLRQAPPLVAPRHVKRAIDYIMTHLAASLTIDELAEVSGVSIRSLQYGFQRFVGMSPKDYVLSQKLLAARRELEAAQGSIAGVAARWGFSNVSRFNAYFKQTFGDTPKEVLTVAMYRRRQSYSPQAGSAVPASALNPWRQANAPG